MGEWTSTFTIGVTYQLDLHLDPNQPEEVLSTGFEPVLHP